MNFYKDRVMLNVLGGSLENAKEVYEAGEKHVLVGVLSANYPTVEAAVEDMKKYNEVLEGNLSVGLGGGNPAQWKAVGDIAKEVKANHYNQVFTAVSYTRANVGNDEALVNCLVSPSGTPGKVVISTGPLSSKAEVPALVDVNTAIAMIKDMGGTSIKFFPMHGLACRDELVAVAKACAENDLMLEPTGGIDLNNFREILSIILDAGVRKTIPHVYSSIIDKATGNTRPEDVRKLLAIVKELVG
ncbi:MAG: KDGP aldolase family protein [Erysipelotrichaceae bacterium]|nr:KDGP aldolase family protein [Erysipelotrichaceae bacterium]